MRSASLSEDGIRACALRCELRFRDGFPHESGWHPLYKLARQGKTIERAPRPIHIHSFDLQNIRLDQAEADFVVRCSKGTYIRTLAADLGRALGCGAHLHELRRLQSGDLHVDQACNMADVKTWELPELTVHVLPIPQFS